MGKVSNHLKEAANSQSSVKDSVRIAKFLSDAGIASRREAEKMIASGEISVNGKILDTPAFLVSEADTVRAHGKIVQKNAKIGEIFMFHKPVGVITSTRDPEGRRTIYDILPAKYKNLKYIGRLDFNTSGLLLMTDDGELARKMTLPDSNIERVYLAKVGRTWTMDDEFVDRLLKPVRKGIKIDGLQYRPMKIKRLSATDFEITITEGKKNEIRIVFEHIGMPIRALHRISYGPYSLGNLPVGCIVNTKFAN